MHIHQDEREHIGSSRFDVLPPYPIVFNDFLYKNPWHSGSEIFQGHEDNAGCWQLKVK